MTTAAGGPPDPAGSLYVFLSGRKGSGKSHIARRWFDSYPYDRLVVDITHDLRNDLRRDGVPFRELDLDVLPARLAGPADPDDAAAQTWLVCPDMGSPTWWDDTDRALGLALGRGPMLIWVDEYGTVTRAGKTGPNMRRILHHGRHDRLSLLLCCPRPIDVDPLGIAQADLIYTFRTPQVYDRQRVADTTGVDRGLFDETNAALGEHEYMLYDARTDTLSHMPALPSRRRGLASLPPVPAPAPRR
jgi:hypothetical protein